MTAGEVLAAGHSFPFTPLRQMLEDRPFIVVAPHPDDESLACGGLIAEACRQGLRGRVVIVSDGSGSHPNSKAYPPDRLRSIREEEARRAGAELGLRPEEMLFLGLPDRFVPREGKEAERAMGDHVVRVLFPRDARNISGTANPVTEVIQQKQIPGFSINTSDQLISYGQSVTISGVLDEPSSTTTPEPSGTPVTLWARNAFQNQFTPVADTTTGSDGSYSFAPQMPINNTVYQVRTTLAPRRHSAVLFEGVQDVVSMTPSSTTSEVGGKVTFTGTILPDQAGQVIYLQRLGADGDWHNEEIRFVTQRRYVPVRLDVRQGWHVRIPRPDHRRPRKRRRRIDPGDDPGVAGNEHGDAPARLLEPGECSRTAGAAPPPPLLR